MGVKAEDPLACICDRGPNCWGPDQSCPQHGDVRWYAEWLSEARTELAVKDARITELEALLLGLSAPYEPGAEDLADYLANEPETRTLAELAGEK